MGSRTGIPRKIEKAIFQQFGLRCPFCGESDVSTLQIHHIESYADVNIHEEENLILVCANCHSRIRAGEIPKTTVYQKKIEGSFAKPNMKTSPNNVISLECSTNNGVIANQLIINAKSRSQVRIVSPSGTIASSRDQRNYIKYLIDRYHEFKRVEVGDAQMNYAVFYASIKRKFGAKWDHIAENRFEDLVAFVQHRIDRTILGKTQRAKGVRNYSTYEEYIEKHRV